MHPFKGTETGEDCSAGFICIHQMEADRLDSCSPGHYCPLGTNYEIECATGSYAITGGSDDTVCSDCPIGRVLPGEISSVK